MEDQNMARVCIVPCGLNYFRGHRFRSKCVTCVNVHNRCLLVLRSVSKHAHTPRCVVEYGQPLFLSNTLVEVLPSTSLRMHTCM